MLAAKSVAAALAAVLAMAALGPAWAQSKSSRQSTHTQSGVAAPKPIGKFDDWLAATHVEAGQTVCYAFVRATSSVPKLPGRGDIVLTVTHRPSGRDAVAISAGFRYEKGAEVTVQIEQGASQFYTSGRSAFARDGHATVTAFEKGRQAIARSSGPHGTQLADTFSLRGFSAAYAAISKACPASR